MKFSVAASLAFAAGAMAQSGMPAYPTNGTYYTTITTTAITTYCPYATTLTQGGKTYTITEATTLTITDCPCTLTKAIIPTLAPSTVLYTSCPPSASAAPAPPMKSIAPLANSAYTNPLTVIYNTPAATKSGVASGTGVSPTKPAMFSGAATANTVGMGALAAVAGVVAFAL